MTGEQLVTLYQSGHQQRAVELARALGGEAERLMVAAHQSRDATEGASDLLSKVEQMWTDSIDGDPPHLDHDRWCALCRFLGEAIRWWFERYFDLMCQLRRLEVTYETL